MRRKPLILVAFLLVLYIAPMIVISSPNKDFALSGAVEYSSDSVNYFDETLDDDVTTMPDGWFDPTIQQVDYGDDDCLDSWDIDDSWWVVFEDDEPWQDPENAVIYSDFMISGFEYSAYAFGANVEGYLQTYDISVPGYVNITTIPNTGIGGAQWYNGSVKIIGHDTTRLRNIIRLRAGVNDTGTGYVAVDYLELRFHYMTLTSYYLEPHFGESFWNISDWQFESESSGLPAENFTTDGDVATLALDFDDINNEVVRYNTSLNSIPIASYIEFRWKTSPSNGGTLSTALTIYLDDIALGSHAYSADWTTTKILISDYCTVAPTTLAIEADDYSNLHASDSGWVKLDYIRIGPSTEMGWGHDCSTIIDELTETTGSVSSNGYSLTFTADDAGDSLFLYVDHSDVGADRAFLDTIYYPFFAFSVIDATGNYRLDIRDKGAGSDTLHAYSDDLEGVFRYNMKSVTDSFSYVRVYLESADTSVTFQYLKAYSIANWSFLFASGMLTDICYVESNSLVFDKSSVAYVGWVFDPSLSVNTTIYNTLNITTGTWAGSGEYSYATDYDVGAGWVGITEDESSYALASGTLEAFKIIVRDSGAISAIKFWGIVPAWNVVNDVDLVFYVSDWHIVNSIVVIFATEINEYSLNLLLLFLGLAMIPGSTCYLVYGGKNKMSYDKLFYGLIAFAIGWALFLGGIYI